MKSKKPIESLILTLRGQKVILDADLAELYDVPTKRLNEQVKRNADRFPEDFIFQLTAQEWTQLKSKITESNVELPQKEGVALNWSRFATSWQQMHPSLNVWQRLTRRCSNRILRCAPYGIDYNRYLRLPKKNPVAELALNAIPNVKQGRA